MNKIFLLLLIIFVSLKAFTQDARKIFYKTATFKTIAVPTLLISYGIICSNNHGLPSSIDVKNYRDKNFSNFHTLIDDYMVFMPAAAVYGLDLLNVKSSHDPLNQTILFAKTSFLTMGIVYVLKYTTGITRPDGSDNQSFPSAHTAMAFAYATVLHEEYKNIWVSIGGYAIAAATGGLRILNNKHWFSDVVTGAGTGILSTKVAYLTHRNKYTWAWRKNTTLVPCMNNQQAGIVWQKKF